MELIRKKSADSEQQKVGESFDSTSQVDQTEASEKNKENKKIKANSSLKEQEFYNSLSNEDKENYRTQQLNKKKLVVNFICLILVLAIGFGGKFYLESHLNEVIAKNEELKVKADSLQRDIKSLEKTETLLEDVAVSGLMSKTIFEQRDEVLDLLNSVESLTPNDLTFRLNKIQRNGAFNYKIDYELVPKEDPSSLNKAIVDTAYMVETMEKSKSILSIANRDAYHFEITEFKGTSYSKSTGTFPLSITVRMVKDDKKVKKLNTEAK